MCLFLANIRIWCADVMSDCAALHRVAVEIEQHTVYQMCVTVKTRQTHQPIYFATQT